MSATVAAKHSHTVRFFDFDDPFPQRVASVSPPVQGPRTKKNIRTDVMLFVNGIPLAIIECKSPTLGEAWKQEALDQFSRTRRWRTATRTRHAKLFETIQLLIATAGQGAVYGTVPEPHRFFVEWKTPYPRTEDQLATTSVASPTPGDSLRGMLSPAAFLDLVRNFIVSSAMPRPAGTVRKLCRYQQFAAVNKAIQRARTAKKPTERGGVVWHTQGLGQEPDHAVAGPQAASHPITRTRRWSSLRPQGSGRADRKTFVACGFPNPDQAQRRELRELLSGAARQDPS